MSSLIKIPVFIKVSTYTHQSVYLDTDDKKNTDFICKVGYLLFCDMNIIYSVYICMVLIQCELHIHEFIITVHTSNILKIFFMPYCDLSFLLLVLFIIISSSKQLVIYYPLIEITCYTCRPLYKESCTQSMFCIILLK